MTELESKLRPPLEALLEPGEELRGVCVATQSSLFKGRMVGIGVTDGRVLVQGLSRKFEPDGPAIALTPERIADASAEGAGGGWPNVSAAIMDQVSVTLRLRTTRGETQAHDDAGRGTGDRKARRRRTAAPRRADPRRVVRAPRSVGLSAVPVRRI